MKNVIRMDLRKAHLVADSSDFLMKKLDPASSHFLISASLMFLRDYGSFLFKGRGHKYIKRIPHTTKSGKKTYRYIYDVTQSYKGKSAFDASHLVAGTKFALKTRKGSEVHGHITKTEGDTVTYVIDSGKDKGKEVTTTKRELQAQLNQSLKVAEQVSKKIKRKTKDLKQAKKTGTEKQISRIEKQLSILNTTLQIFEEKSKDPDGEKQKTDEEKADELLREIKKKLAEEENKNEKVSRPINEMHKEILKSTLATDEDVDLKKVYSYLSKEEYEALANSDEQKNPEQRMFKRINRLRYNSVNKYNNAITKAFEDIQELVGDELNTLAEIDEKLKTSKLIKLKTERRDLEKKIDDKLAKAGVLFDPKKPAPEEYEIKAIKNRYLKPQGNNKAEVTDIHKNLIYQFKERTKEVYQDREKTDVVVYYNQKNGRASCSSDFYNKEQDGDVQINLRKTTDSRTVLHECAHALEIGQWQGSTEIKNAVTVALLKRTKVNNYYTIYGDDEQTLDDEFTHDYTGKVYDTNSIESSTEVVSMGIEKFLPGLASRFLIADPHHFALSYAILKGYVNE